VLALEEHSEHLLKVNRSNRQEYRPTYVRFSICTVYKYSKVPSQITMIFIIHC